MAATGNEVVTISQLKTTIDSIDTSSSSIDAYPVGSIYMSVNSTSPATLFGGTWQRIQDRFLLCAGVTYANSSAESGNTQLNYYKTSSNRVKKMNGVADGWWERSPDGAFLPSFCVVVNNGNAYIDYASNRTGISPFGCI